MFGISFLSPWFLAAAAATAIPIALHLFRRRTDVVIDFPSVRLLQRVPIERQRRRRLREILLMLLRVAALCLLAVSFARPYVAMALAPLSAPITVVAVDRSMSVSSPGEFPRLQDAARRAIANAPGAHAVALVAFDDAAETVVPPTMDRRAVVNGIDALAAGAGGTRYRTALARVSDVIGARQAHVVLVTDLQRAGWETNDRGGLPADVTAEVVSVSGPRSNLAVTAAERLDRDVVATLQNYGATAAPTTVKLVVNGTVVAQQTVTLAAQAATDVRLSGAVPSSGSAEVVVDDANGFQPDNVRYVILDPTPAQPITIVVADPAGTSGGLYLERALSVADRGRQFRVEAIDGRVVSGWDAAAIDKQAAVFIVGTRTLDRRGRDLLAGYLRRGGHVFLTLGPDVDVPSLVDTVGVAPVAEPDVVKPAAAVTLVINDARHPIFRAFLSASGAMGDVAVEQFRRVKNEAKRSVLAHFSGGDIALTEESIERGRLIIFTSDLDNRWGRFPLSPSFVPFVVEAARYLTASRHAPQSWTLPDTPADVAPVPGIATVKSPGGDAQLVAVNVDTRESDPSTVSLAEFTGAIGRTERVTTSSTASDARHVEDLQRWWRVGLMVMLAALAGEALLGRRTA